MVEPRDQVQALVVWTLEKGHPTPTHGEERWVGHEVEGAWVGHGLRG